MFTNGELILMLLVASQTTQFIISENTKAKTYSKSYECFRLQYLMCQLLTKSCTVLCHTVNGYISEMMFGSGLLGNASNH